MNTLRALGVIGIAVGASLLGPDFLRRDVIPSALLALTGALAAVEACARRGERLYASNRFTLLWLVPAMGVAVLAVGGVGAMLPVALTGHPELLMWVPFIALFGAVFAVPVGLMLATLALLLTPPRGA